jgi:serine/threonine-protein kinase
MHMSGNEARHRNSDSNPSFAPGKVISQYQIIEHLGTGGMGEVYLARDTSLNRQVAIKFLKPGIAADSNLRRLFDQEARSMAALNHPNITVIHEVGKFEHRPYFVMEHIDGNTLESIINEIPLPIDQVINVAEQVCSGLETIHRAGMIHRDIKPSNIMIDSGGRVRILDFGLSQAATGDDGSSKQIGTISYMSPEQVTAEVLTPGSDLFSVGVVLYQMVTGGRPFTGTYDAAIQYAVVNQDPKPINELRPDAPAKLIEIIDRLLKKNPGERYRNAAEVVSELESAGFLGVSGSKSSESPPKSRFGISWLMALVVILLVIVIWKWFLPDLGVKDESLPRSLAVLPFKNLGPTEDEYFAEGITNDIISHLATIKGLLVISRTGSMRYRDSVYVPGEIGEDLGVSYILTGTILWDKSTRPNEVRIHPQLIRTADEAHIWGQSFDRMYEKIFDLQTDIAEEVTAVLKIAVSEADRQKIMAVPTANLDAYDFFLRGNHLFNHSWDQHDIINATEMFRQAIELDTSFALAYAMLARGHESMFWEYYDRSEERCRKALEAAEKALTIHPGLVEGHLAMGYYYYHCEQNYEQALAEFSTVLETRPNYADLYSAVAAVQRRKGNMAEAVDNFIKSLEFDPRSNLKAIDVAITYGMMRQFDLADEFLEKAIILAPGIPLPYVFKAWCQIFNTGDTATARRVLLDAAGKTDIAASRYYWWIVRIIEPDGRKVIAASHPGTDSAGYALHLARMYRLLGDEKNEYLYSDSAKNILEDKIALRPEDARFNSQLGLAYAGLRNRDLALTHAGRALELLPTSRDAFDAIFFVVNMAEVHVIFGEYDEAIDNLEHLMMIPGFMSAPYLRLDPLWKPLHSHPRFQRLISEAS